MPSSSQQGEGRLKKRWEQVALHKAAWPLLAPLPSLAGWGRGRGRLGLRVRVFPGLKGGVCRMTLWGWQWGLSPVQAGELEAFLAQGRWRQHLPDGHNSCKELSLGNHVPCSQLPSKRQ